MSDRIRIKNELNNRIKEIGVIIRRIDETLYNITRSNLGRDFVEKSKQKNLQKKEDLEKELIDLENKLRNLENGVMDSEMILEAENDKKYSAEIREREKNSKKNRDDAYKMKEKKSKESWQKQREEFNSQRASEREIAREFNHFLNAIDSLPDYIIKNLKDMPNNKGYIFKGVTHLGRLPAEPGQPEILFEKQRDGTLIINEYFKDRTRISRKDKDGKKVVIRDEKIERKFKPVIDNNIVFKTKKKN
jgi:hypothetical protein